MPPEKPTVTARRSPNPTFTGTLYSGKNRTTAVATKVDDSVEIRPKSVQSQFGKLVRYQFGAQHLRSSFPKSGMHDSELEASINQT